MHIANDLAIYRGAAASGADKSWLGNGSRSQSREGAIDVPYGSHHPWRMMSRLNDSSHELILRRTRRLSHNNVASS